MVPISGKPVIGWILDDLAAKGIANVTIVLSDPKLGSYIERVYGSRFSLHLVEYRDSPSILHSLREGLRENPSSVGARVILGDTLIQDSYDSEVDFIYVGEVDSPRNWCVVATDGSGAISEFFDKQGGDFDRGLAAAGYYHLLDKRRLEACVDACIADGRRELSAALRKYMDFHTVYARSTSEWFDFGHIDNLVNARFQLLQPRYFNSVKLNSFSHTVTKQSINGAKLLDELNWYLELPKPLQVFTPRLLDYSSRQGGVFFTQEFYGYPTLAELYLFSDLTADTWSYSILRTLLRIHSEFRKYRGEVMPDEARTIYLTKTFERLEQLRSQHNDELMPLLEAPYVLYNGSKLRNIPELKASIQSFTEQVVEHIDGCIIHGDFCFSNILFDINNLIVRLIDPRGSFGKSGVYGDPRYDIAKLRHSISGGYDYIISDLFELECGDNTYHAQLHATDLFAEVEGEFDKMIRELGYSLREVKFIEGLLFVSMIPLHHGHPRRQKLMYLTGLDLLNQVL